jgi:DNA-binding beta-propeller fold protein YncE
VAVDRRDGSAWVLDYYANCIRKYDASWNFVFETANGEGEPLIRRATSIACDQRNGVLWVADRSHNRVLKLGAGGALKATVNGFNQPRTVSVDPVSGACWVADELNHRVMKLPAGVSGTANAGAVALVEVVGFDQPRAAIADAGGAWVLDEGTSKVIKVGADGGKTAFITGFDSPVDAVVLPSKGFVFVVDEDAGRVVRFPRAFSGTATIDEIATVKVTGFTKPTDVEADEEGGFIFVSDGDAVSRVTLNGQLKNKITEGLVLPGGAGVDPGQR